MRFLVDTQLPPLLARHLISLGHEARHTAEVGLASGSDRDVWQYAVANFAILITRTKTSSRSAHSRTAVRPCSGSGLAIPPSRCCWTDLPPLGQPPQLRWSEARR